MLVQVCLENEGLHSVTGNKLIYFVKPMIYIYRH